MDQLEEICQSRFDDNYVIFNGKYCLDVWIRDVDSEKREQEEMEAQQMRFLTSLAEYTLRDHSAQ
jgi:hypothetical protein